MSMSSEAAVVVTQTILGCWVSMATGTWDGAVRWIAQVEETFVRGSEGKWS